MFGPLLKTLHTISRYRNAMNAEANDLWFFFSFITEYGKSNTPYKNEEFISIISTWWISLL